MSESTILVTGSKGLIGKALINKLSRLGFQIKAIDIAYPSHHSEYGNFQNKEFLQKFASHCTGIVHLAGVSRVIMGQQNPLLCWNVNVEGSRTVLEIAKNLPHKPWVIYASSREVYGQQDKLPVKEQAPLFPLNIYARSKAAAEEHVLSARKEGLQTAIIRFSNVYGSVDDYPDRVIPAFCRAAAFGGTIRIEGAQNLFDFTYIEDTVAGIIKVIDKLEAGCLDLPTVHLLTGRGSSLLQAAQLAKQLSKKPVNFSYAPARSFDVSSFYGDPTLAKELLSWQAKISLEEGMEQLIKDFMAEPSRFSVNACMV